MSDLNQRFGVIVRRYRNDRLWSQEELAAVAGLNRTYLGEIERGTAVPSLHTIAKLAEAFELTPAQLLLRCEFLRH